MPAVKKGKKPAPEEKGPMKAPAGKTKFPFPSKRSGAKKSLGR